MHLILLILNACFQVTKNIEGIFIDWSWDIEERIQLTNEAFRKMNRLRLLKVKYNTTV